MFRPINSLSKIDEVSDQIKSLILEGLLLPNDVFPSESELAEQLNVSRTVIRESKKSLIGMGLLEVRGKRTYVSNDIIKTAVGILSFGFQLEDSSIEEFMEARRIIENETAFLAAKRGNDENFEKMKFYILKQEEAIEKDDKVLFGDYDLKWHSTVADASRNRLLAKMLQAIRNLLSAAIAMTLEVPLSDQQAFIAHKEITKAITNRNPESAKLLMDQHLNTIHSILSSLAKETDERQMLRNLGDKGI